MPFPLPLILPTTYTAADPDVDVSLEVDTGGYDILIGGHGFRLASDQQNPYTRNTEEITSHRFDSSLEPGEQSLAPLPWIKSQASFHAGAGQLNLEQGFTAFQYEQEQVEHIRYDASYGVDPWTPGKVTRLPDVHAFNYGTSKTVMCSANIGTYDYAVVGGAATFFTAQWNGGSDIDPTPTDIDLTGTDFNGASNCTVQSVCTDGQNYYAYIALTTPVSTHHAYVVKGTLDSSLAPTVLYNVDTVATGVLAWVEARLVAGIGNSFYELNPNVTAHSALPTTPNYTHPTSTWTWTAFAGAPQGVLGAGNVGGQSSILEFDLTSSGGTPVLSGGQVQWSAPIGERILALSLSMGAILGIGTTRGIRIATFSEYTGHMHLVGPLSYTSTNGIQCLTTRDRFFYGGITGEQQDGSSGLVAVDFSMVVDAAGRNAYAPHLRAPSSMVTRNGAVTACTVLPGSGRLVYLTPQGLHVEGNGPGTDGPAWIRTSRIRYDTTEPKLFKVGRIRGALDVSSVQVTAILPFGAATNVGTFGFITDDDPGEFRLPSSLVEWLQMEFSLSGAECILSGYSVKALPAPTPSELITVTCECFERETDRWGQDVFDPETPRQRWKNVRDLAIAGGEVKLVEFTLNGPVTQMVRVEQVAFQSADRPTDTDDFGGYITVKMRSTEGS